MVWNYRRFRPSPAETPCRKTYGIQRVVDIKPKSENHLINGLNYHVQRWGEAGGNKIFLLHGWGDAGLSFQFLAEAMLELGQGRLEIVAPDWRGFGQTQHAVGGYWFADYYADLDKLLDHYSPGEPVVLVGHSMGGHVACMYAGIRPERVTQLVSVEGLGLRPVDANSAPNRFAQWLDEVTNMPTFKQYAKVDELAGKLCDRSGRIDIKRGRFIAEAWTRRSDDGSGFVLRADPRHRRVNPVIYRHEETLACWKKITARLLSITGSDSGFLETYEDTGALTDLSEIIEDFAAKVIDDSGHMIHHEQPARLAAAVLDWLE